jgi:hypothetical protein
MKIVLLAETFRISRIIIFTNQTPLKSPAFTNLLVQLSSIEYLF